MKVKSALYMFMVIELPKWLLSICRFLKVFILLKVAILKVTVRISFRQVRLFLFA